MYYRWGAHWHNLAIELSVCGDAALCQITLTTNVRERGYCPGGAKVWEANVQRANIRFSHQCGRCCTRGVKRISYNVSNMLTFNNFGEKHHTQELLPRYQRS